MPAGVHHMLMMTCTDISSHEALFARYTESFCETLAHTPDVSMLRLKITHTQQVLRYMRLLVCAEKALAPHARACELSALYHDIGRFEQFLQYKTFRDTESVNHALQGLKVLKKEGFLQDEPKALRAQIMAAVGMHNRYTLPQGLDKDLRDITCAVRDADKLDILRIMAEQFSPCPLGQTRHEAVTFYAKDEPLLWSQGMLDDIMQNRLASYKNIVYINDFKLLLGSWVYDMTYTNSKRIMLQEGHLHKILDTLPQDPAMHKVKAHIIKLLHAAQS